MQSHSEWSPTPIWDDIRSRRPDPFAPTKMPDFSKRERHRMNREAARITDQVCKELGINAGSVEEA